MILVIHITSDNHILTFRFLPHVFATDSVQKAGTVTYDTQRPNARTETVCISDSPSQNGEQQS